MMIAFTKTFLFLLAGLSSLHPLHVSVTEIEFDPKEKELEVVMRVFMDDLETALRADVHQSDLDVLNPPAGQPLDKIVDAYISKHFRVMLDRKAFPAKYLGHEQDGDSFVFYIQVANVKKFKSIEVRNDLLTETFDDQSNLVHVTLNDVVKSLRLTKENPSDVLTFDTK